VISKSKKTRMELNKLLFRKEISGVRGLELIGSLKENLLMSLKESKMMMATPNMTYLLPL